MRKIFIILFLFQTFLGFSQCPDGDVILPSQEKVDEFVRDHGDCKNINGSLRIIAGLTTGEVGGLPTTVISDISGLNFIENITGNLLISVDIGDLNGFNNLKDVGGSIAITNCKFLKKINGFNSLTRVQNITIALNPELESISGFNGIEDITKSLEIGESTILKDISGFTNLRVVNEQLNISINPELLRIPEFNKLEKIQNDLNFTENPKLEAVSGFSELNYVGNDFNIHSAKIIRGFEKLKIIERFFDIGGLRTEELASFNLLENVGGAFRIANTSIKKINGFNALERVGEKYFLEDWFIMNNNKALSEVKGFGKFIKLEGFLEVQDNIVLSDCSWLCNLFNNGEITGTVTIQNNLGDCISAARIIEICDPDFDDDNIADVVDLDDDNDGILDTVEGNGDTDRDGFIDSKDLDSDNDNCFDVLEAGFSDPNNDGILGDLPDTVNADGTISNETTGYTTPSDSNNNNIFDFQETNVLDPGKNNIVELCNNSGDTDLFTVLNGNPDPGGTWSPALSSGNGILIIYENSY